MGSIFILLFVLVIMTAQIMANVRNDRKWHEGLFDREQTDDGRPYDRLLEAYISIGALMIRKDTVSYSEKILYLNSYFSKNFPHSHYDFGRSIP
jgi:DnaJ like chaperone protein